MRITYKIRRTADGYEGTVTWPDKHGYTNATTMAAATKDKALGRAAAMAAHLADSPAVQAILPPGGAVALKALGRVAKSDAARKAFKYLGKLL